MQSVISVVIFFLTFNLSGQGYFVQPFEPIGNRIVQKTVVGLPVRLRIPKIKVDANIEYAGLTSDGAMAVPRGLITTAWYNLGPRPGEVGSAVIDGHYGWKNRKSAVFDNLHKLQPGDLIFVEDDQGVINIFVVRGSRRFDPEADAVDIFSSNDGVSHLNLITCEGIWSKAAKSFSERLVVFADKE